MALEAKPERQTFSDLFPPSEVEQEFTRLREGRDPALEPEPEPEPERVLRVEVFEELGVDPSTVAAVLDEHPDIDALLPHADPSSDDEVRQNIIAAARLKDQIDARSELRARDLRDAMDAAAAAVDEYDEDAARERLTELYQLVDDGSRDEVAEFLQDLREEAPEIVDGWAVDTKLQDDGARLFRQVVEETQRVEQAQAEQIQRQEAFAEAAEAARSRHRDWDSVAPVIGKIVAADPNLINDAPAAEAAATVEQLYRSAREVVRAERLADWRTAFRAEVLRDTSLGAGLHTAGNEPDWDAVKRVEPEVRLENVRPKRDREESLAGFKAFMLADPVRDEFERLRRSAGK